MTGRCRAALEAVACWARWCRPAVLVATVALLPAAPPAWAAGKGTPFRLCADPDNLPFSSSSAATPGLYIELGRAIAARLGRPFDPVWTRTYFAKHEIRTTLLAGHCDGFIGVPDEPGFMGPRLIFSKPILSLGYAFVVPKDTQVGSISDLKGRRVAVQFASPPQSILATRTDIEAVTVLSPEEAMRDLVDRKADAAFIWGPSAGWIDKTELHGAYRVVPAEGDHLQWRATIGFPHGQAETRDQVDQALTALSGTTEALMAKYGFPTAAPVHLVASEAVAPGPGGPAPTPPAASTPTAGDAAQVAAGHKLFNDNCAHCHGPDAIQGERRINLRLLRHRYGDDMDQTFMTTVTHGRPAKGMPNWSGILTDQQFGSILAFLHSVQEP